MWQRPIIQYIEEPSISALRVKAEKEEEMKTLDDYWKDRLQKQEVKRIQLIVKPKAFLSLTFLSFVDVI